MSARGLSALVVSSMIVGIVSSAAAAQRAQSPAGAESRVSETTTIELRSGNGSIGSQDGRVEWFDGTAWQPAWVIPRNPAWDVISGTRYVFATSDGCCKEFTHIRFRIKFRLPEGFANASISGSVLADNAATVSVNTTSFTIMPDEEIADNYLNPPATFVDSNQADFHAGVNILRFKLHNFAGPGGLDFDASVTFN
jgi:hypothetical protein